jgi:long-chain acyl-CoA synthetase
MNLTKLLDETAHCRPQKPALVEGATVVSYADLVQATGELSRRLKAFNLTAGTRVGLHYPNSIHYVTLIFALWRLQVVVVPIPMECTEEELSAIATTMRLAAIISRQPRQSSELFYPDCHFTKLATPEPPDNHGLNIAFIRFTSGTTGACKGVVLSHEAVCDRILAANKSLHVGPEDTVIWCLPMSHHFLATIVLYLSRGATIVLTRQILSRSFLETVNRWRGTVLYAAPFHYALLARDDSGLTISSVRLAVSTTCSLPTEVAENFRRRFRLPLTPVLGLIELGLVCVNDDPASDRNSVGRPQPDYALRIRQPDADGYGEVLVTGPGFFDAYDNPWTWREELMPDGWFATGDIGRLDAQGRLYLAGRKTAVINLAGRKIFPEEIEAVLNRHPAVRESRAYGVPHLHLGELVAAEIVVRTPVEPDAIREFCRTRLSRDKIPGEIQIVPAIAKTAVTGKIRRPAATVVA